jgi:hypothetical protein
MVSTLAFILSFSPKKKRSLCPSFVLRTTVGKSSRRNSSKTANGSPSPWGEGGVREVVKHYSTQRRQGGGETGELLCGSSFGDLALKFVVGGVTANRAWVGFQKH